MSHFMSRLLAFVAIAGALLIGGLGITMVPASTAVAQETDNPSGLAVPRYATIGRSRVNMRQGPSTSHRILWVYAGQEGLPVEVVAETELWRQIRDPEGDIGWVHHALLSNERGAVVQGSMRPLRRQPAADAATMAYLEPRVVASLNECSEDWCQISVDNYTGWVRHDEVWGVYPAEVVR